jgi:hypothetical protein
MAGIAFATQSRRMVGAANGSRPWVTSYSSMALDGIVRTATSASGQSETPNHVRGDGSVPRKRSPGAGDGCAAADQRKHWAAVFANKDFVEGFASKFRPLVMTQEVKLLTAAPWGPHP